MRPFNFLSVSTNECHKTSNYITAAAATTAAASATRSSSLTRALPASPVLGPEEGDEDGDDFGVSVVLVALLKPVLLDDSLPLGCLMVPDGPGGPDGAEEDGNGGAPKLL